MTGKRAGEASQPVPLKRRVSLKGKAAVGDGGATSRPDTPVPSSQRVVDHPTLDYLRKGLQADSIKEFLATAGQTKTVDVAGMPAFHEDLLQQNLEKWGALVSIESSQLTLKQS